VVFSCPSKGGKILSVCAGPGRNALQYRFGKPGAIELEYPPKPSASAFTLGEVTYVRAMGYVLRFTNAGVRYEVTSLSGGGCCSPEEAASNNFQGVYVSPPGADTVDVPCTGDVTDNLEALYGSGVLAPLEGQ
jgi:hypothetical protein